MIRNRSTVVAVIAGLSLGALTGLSAFFAWPMLVQSKALTPPGHPKLVVVAASRRSAMPVASSSAATSIHTPHPPWTVRSLSKAVPV